MKMEMLSILKIINDDGSVNKEMCKKYVKAAFMDDVNNLDEDFSIDFLIVCIEALKEIIEEINGSMETST